MAGFLVCLLFLLLLLLPPASCLLETSHMCIRLPLRLSPSSKAFDKARNSRNLVLLLLMMRMLMMLMKPLLHPIVSSAHPPCLSVPLSLSLPRPTLLGRPLASVSPAALSRSFFDNWASFRVCLPFPYYGCCVGLLPQLSFPLIPSVHCRCWC